MLFLSKNHISDTTQGGRLGPVFESETFLCGVCMFSPCPRGFTPVLRFPPTVKKHVNWGLVPLKLPIGVNVSVDGCLSLYVSPVMNWRLVQGVPCLRPMMLG